MLLMCYFYILKSFKVYILILKLENKNAKNDLFIYYLLFILLASFLKAL